jgi:GT2 family glycosyltransferase/glycosyltransferase involved in cell wall biosynthesis
MGGACNSEGSDQTALSDRGRHTKVTETQYVPRTSIIVPIYDAVEATTGCLQALENTLASESNYQVVLVDDASPDPRIRILLEEWSKQTNCVHQIVRRSKNGGFIQTVNEGFNLTMGDDVVLLNSDTQPIGEWLSELRHAVAANPAIGIVFPATNNASIFSVPIIDDAYQLIGESLADSMKERFHGCLLSTPTAVGFCMFIRKQVINEVGMFETAFGRGYGEENDFCMRARSKGFQIAWVPSSVVLHEGGASMVEAGVIKLGAISVPENERLLRRRHPEYEKDIQETEFRRRLSNLISAIERCILEVVIAKFPPVIHVLHLPPDPEYVGGIEKHVRELSTYQKQLGPVVLAFPAHGFVRLRIQFAKNSIDLDTHVVREAFGNSVDSSTGDQFSRVLALFRPRYVHIHSLIGFTLQLTEQLAQKRIKTVLTIHDYYLASPDVTLMTPIPKDVHHSQELNHFFGKARWNSATWATQGRKAIEATTIVVSPSATARLELEQRLGWSISNIVVLGHPLAEKIESSIDQATNPGSKQKERSVVFLGSVHKIEKGAERVNRLTAELVNHDITVHFLGSAKPDWGGAVWRNSPLVRYHGRYLQDAVSQRLVDCSPSLGILVSPWPETWSYTLTELWSAGVPVAVGKVGAPAERVKTAGFVLDDDDQIAMRQIVDALAFGPGLEQMKFSGVHEIQNMSDVGTYLEAIEERLDLSASPSDVTTSICLTGFEGWAHANRMGKRPKSLGHRIRVKIIDNAPVPVTNGLVRVKRAITKLAS